MRRMIIVPLAGALLLGAAAPVAAGPNTSNASGSGRTLQGEWYTDQGYGAVYIFEESGNAFGDVFEESGTYVQCDPAVEESYGFQGTRVYGWANELTVDVGGRLSDASAAGLFDLTVETVDECVGSYDATQASVSVSVELTGAGPLASFRDRSSFKIPGSYNAHSTYKGKRREATGSVDLGSLGTRGFDWAMIAEYSWSDHSNG